MSVDLETALQFGFFVLAMAAMALAFFSDSL